MERRDKTMVTLKRWLLDGRSLSQKLKRQNPLTTAKGLDNLREWRREFGLMRSDYPVLFRAIDRAVGRRQSAGENNGKAS